MNKKSKYILIITLFVAFGVAIYSWFHVSGKEIEGALELSPACTVTVSVGQDSEQAYMLEAQQIEMLQTLLLTSSFTRTLSPVVITPTGMQQYTIFIDWNNQRDFLRIHGIGSEYLSIVDQFNGKHLKIRNPEWEAALKEILSLSKPSA